jgi:hypothetical protein
MDTTDFMDQNNNNNNNNNIILPNTAPTPIIQDQHINRVLKCMTMLPVIITILGILIILTYGTVKDLALYLDDGTISSEEIIDYIMRINTNSSFH